MARIPVVLGELVAGRYRVDAVIGVGGMGVVVAAWHDQLARTVALKFMTGGAERPGATARFLREARAAGQLRNPHVVRILDADQLTGGAPYLVMEHLEAWTLVPHPGFLFNVGSVYRATDPTRARHFLERYLVWRPEAPNATEVQGWLAALPTRCPAAVTGRSCA